MTSPIQRFRSWRVRRLIKRALKKSSGADRREFVYLDEVSVYSLLASRLGPVTAELTESQSSTLTSETNVEAELSAVAAKAKASSKIQGARASGTQVLRKATIQSTFKQLLGIERPILKSPPHDYGAPFPSLAQLADTYESDSAKEWITDPSKLERGELIEVVVEVAVDPIYRLSAIIETMAELLDEFPAMASSADRAQFDQAHDLNRILDKFMVGLVPLKCRAVDYRCIDLDGKEVLVHRSVLEGLPSAEAPNSREVYVVGVTEVDLYWKDLRRILYSSSRFTILCRIEDAGLHQTWLPVKLVDVLGAVVPDLSGQMRTLGEGALQAITSATSIGGDAQLRLQRSRALEIFGSRLANDVSRTISEATLVQIRRAAEWGSSQDFSSVDSRRLAFDAVQRLVEADTSHTFDPSVVVQLRSEVMVQAGLNSDGSVSNTPMPTPQPTRSDERLLDTEIIAIYW